jgi:uncharacterized protein (DUF1330 family)
MKPLLFAGFLALALGMSQEPTPPQFEKKETRLFEMRIYYAAPGKLNDLHARFRNHTTRLFEKHGMTNIGYWVPVENPESKLIYILAYPDQATRLKAWQGFINDPEWKTAFAESEKNGKLVSKLESISMTATDYSPVLKARKKGKERLFELRTYTAAPGKLNDLQSRFRTVTTRLIAKHGAKNIGYWTLTEGSKGADNTLIFLLAHKSQEAAKESGDKLAKDPEWIAAKAASEKEGILVEGRESVFLKPTDYSPLK